MSLWWTTIFFILFNKSLQFSLLNQLFDLSLQVITIFRIMAVILVETIVLVSRPSIRICHQLTWPLQCWVICDLHEDVIYRSVRRGKVVESLI